MVDSTWETAVALLEAIAAHEHEEGIFISPAVLADRTVDDVEAVKKELRRLFAGSYIDASATSRSFSGDDEYADLHLLERGARVVRMWPSEGTYENLLETLDRRIGETSDDETRTKLEKLRGAVGEVGKGVAESVLSAWFKAMLGLP